MRSYALQKNDLTLRKCPSVPCASALLTTRRWPSHQICRVDSSMPSTSLSLNNGNHAPATVAAPVSPPAPPPPSPGVLPPAAAYNNIVNLGVAKAAMPIWKTLLMGVMAGCYISFGGFLAVTTAGMCAGLGVTNPVLTRLAMGALFPFGLLITLVCGAELYTGNTALLTAAVLEKKAEVKDLAKNWIWSYVGNLIGSLLMVALVVATGLLASSPPVAANMAAAKTAIPFGQALVRGVLCNWLVCSAVWMASAATSLPGKMLAAYLPVMAFIALGLEHSVANMFFCSLGIVQGAPISWADVVLKNLLPVTLGNTIAGAVCMGGMYALCYGGGAGKAQPPPHTEKAAA
ncbi:hypothetical protein VaNZ11_008939 [Volvox africanus]|uniref:Uncharacterized protein n=1 Tax=Volvox africanus TaxID=51714 RepID=A0ABQ5S6I5_9CHLO|nr:hypothetical protein VaNZ11_008939 [Volvox africanus]